MSQDVIDYKRKYSVTAVTLRHVTNQEVVIHFAERSLADTSIKLYRQIGALNVGVAKVTSKDTSAETR